MSSHEAMQRDIVRIALRDATATGFALAGSGAIREHGLIQRPTADVDLFTVMSAQDRFCTAVESIRERLVESGYVVQVVQQGQSFTRMVVSSNSGLQTELDMGIDWRANEPVALEVGPVLAVEDAVANKVAALYSRGETRDFLDVDSIRKSGRYSDHQLMVLAANSDPGFDQSMFAERLQMATKIQPSEVTAYGLSESDLEAVKKRSQDWANDIKQHTTAKPITIQESQSEQNYVRRLMSQNRTAGFREQTTQAGQKHVEARESDRTHSHGRGR